MARPQRPGRGFSLLETAIAVGILGVGLIMVAAIFPVALSQHRDSVYQARATELASKAEAMLRSRLDPNQLWTDGTLLSDGRDSPWYLMPFSNIHVSSGLWGDGSDYANLISGFPLGSNTLALFPADVLSDRFAPRNDVEAKNVANRLVWYGFYRHLANGTVQYAAAICRQQRNQRFAAQDLYSDDNPHGGFDSKADANYPLGFRLPVPWRVQVYRWMSPTGLTNASLVYHPAVGLGELAPPGSKIMIQGTAYGRVPSPMVPAGRILTVSDVLGWSAVEVREDISDLPEPSPTSMGFDAWVFPPPLIGGNESPLIDWKVFL